MVKKLFLYLLVFGGLSLPAKEPTIQKEIFYYDDVKLIEHDVEYAKERCKLDLFIPGNDETKRPVVLFFHGGGLRGGKKYFPEALKSSGAIIVSANYRLSCERAKCPDYLYDAAAAANWVFKHIAEYGGDPDCVIISGHSAGAYLSAMVGMDARYLARFSEKNTRFLLIAPVSGQMTTHFQIQNERLGTHQEIAEHVVVDEYAPIWHAKKGLPPVILLTGGVDLDWPARPQENQLLYSVLRKIHHDERAKIYCIDGFGHSECIEPALTILVKREMWQAYAKQKRVASMPENYLLNSGRKIEFQAQRTGKAKVGASAVIAQKEGKIIVDVTCTEPAFDQLVYGPRAWSSDCLNLYLATAENLEGQWVMDSKGRAEFYPFGLKERLWKASVERTPTGWNAHYEVDLAGIDGKLVKANIVRDRRTKDAREVTCWSPVYGNGFQEKDALVPLVEK